jgi:hypothetical protein
MNNAQPTSSSAAASTHGAASLSLELLEARRLRDELKRFLRTEQSAMADFLVALADFDARRGWEPLGHANLFAFLQGDLGLSRSGTYWRLSAARLVQRFPEVIEPLRDGRLCMSTTAELAKVLTAENRSEVLPRYFGLSAREAQEVTAELAPRPAPPVRELVTRLETDHSLLPVAQAAAWLEPVPSLPVSPSLTGESVQTFGLLMPSRARPAPPPRRDDIEPLTADLRRLHITVSRQLLKKLEAAQSGLGHAIPRAVGAGDRRSGRPAAGEAGQGAGAGEAAANDGRDPDPDPDLDLGPDPDLDPDLDRDGAATPPERRSPRRHPRRRPPRRLAT